MSRFLLLRLSRLDVVLTLHLRLLLLNQDWNITSPKEVQEKGKDASGAHKYMGSIDLDLVASRG